MPVFELKHSRQAAVAVMVVSAVALFALVISDLPGPLAVAGSLSVALLAWRTAWPGKRRLVALSARTDGQWSAHHADGRTVTGVLQPGSFVHPWLCVVVLRDGWRRISVCVPADALTPDAHRRLRVLLRWLPRPCARPTAFWSRQSPWPG